MSRPPNEHSALDLIEEGVNLLRATPALLGLHLAGSVPFVLGFLYFWADMSRSAYAEARLAPASLLLALGIVWMKCWQSVFALALRERLSGGRGEPWRVGRAARLALVQAALQPWGLILLLPAVLLTLPFPWFFAFFQNVAVLGADGSPGVRQLATRAAAQARLWPRQNVLLCLHISLVALLAFLNVVSLMVALPFLLKIFLGVQTALTESPAAYLNTTFWAVALALTYVLIDPLVKATYALRCFQGESLRTGEALRAELRRLARLGAGALLVALLAWGGTAGVAAASAPAPTTTQPKLTVEAGRLDEAIGQTMREPRYAWRMPRQLKTPVKRSEKHFLELWIEGVAKTMKRWVKACCKWLERVSDWFAKWFKPKSRVARAPASPQGSGIPGFAIPNLLLYLLLAMVLCALGLFAVYAWRHRWRLSEAKSAPAPAPAAQPDLRDERTAADQLPSDGWLTLARQMIERGELRLALRAYYLAKLALLAQAGLIRIQRSKANRDYLRELLRRAHAWPGLAELFGESVRTFDRSWYGAHEVTPESLHQFEANHERMRELVG